MGAENPDSADKIDRKSAASPSGPNSETRSASQADFASPLNSRWPRLGYNVIGQLDYMVPQYDAQWLLDAAALIQPFETQDRRLLSVSECLRKIAETPAAIKELNHHRPLAPREIVALNRAVHYRVYLERLGKNQEKRARATIADVWHVAEPTIRDDDYHFGDEAQRVIESLFEHASVADRIKGRNEFLEDFDLDLHGQAARMSKPSESRKATGRVRKK